MGNGIRNQKTRAHTNAEQNHKTYKDRGGLGDRAKSLIELIGLERLTRRDFGYEGTFYVTEDGETYDDEYVDTHNPPRIGIEFYEVSKWRYNRGKKIDEPVIRRIVMIKIEGSQLTLNL